MPPDETHFVNAGLTAQEAEARVGKFGRMSPRRASNIPFAPISSISSRIPWC